MDPETMAANAGPDTTGTEGVAAPTESGELAPAGVPAEQTPAEPTPQVTETQAFSRRLNEMTAAKEREIMEKVNTAISRLGGTRPDGQPIRTFEDLQAALDLQTAQEEAAKANIPVEIYQRLNQAERDAQEAKNMLSGYERREAMEKEAASLSSDPKWGEFFKANETAIREAALKHGVGLGTAKLLVYDEVGPQKVDEDAIANRAIQDYLDHKRTFNRPTEGSGTPPVTVVETPKTWSEARDGAYAYLRSLRES